MGFVGGQTSSEKTTPGATILVVDDDPLLREAASEILALKGFGVLEASDGLEAVALFRSHAQEISLVLMDVKMPRMDGLEATRRLRALTPDAKVILSSGYTGLEIQSVKPNAFLPKPYRGSALCDLVMAVLAPA